MFELKIKRQNSTIMKKKKEKSSCDLNGEK